MSGFITKTIVKPTHINLTQHGQQITDLSYAKFKVGDLITVKWNNVEYKCTVKGINPGHAIFGNTSLYNGTEFGPSINSGEPFLFIRIKPYTYILTRKLGPVVFEITQDLDENDQLEEVFNDDLPEDFPRFRFQGESFDHSDILFTPYTGDFTSGYLVLTDYKGQIKWYKKTPSFCYNFKQNFNNDGKIRYSYMVAEEPYGGQYELCYGVLMNENMEVINDNINSLSSHTKTLNGIISGYSEQNTVKTHIEKIDKNK